MKNSRAKGTVSRHPKNSTRFRNKTSLFALVMQITPTLCINAAYVTKAGLQRDELLLTIMLLDVSST